MLITLLSFIIAIFLLIYSAFFPIPSEFFLTFAAGILALGGTALLIAQVVAHFLLLTPLTIMQKGTTSYLMELVQKDFSLSLGRVTLFLLPIISYVLASILIFAPLPFKMIGFTIGLVILGLNLDLMRSMWQRSIHLLNPFYLVDSTQKIAKRGIEKEQDDVLWQSLDSMVEIAVHAIERSQLALSTHVLGAFPSVLKNFFDFSKSISHTNQDKQIEKKTGLDEATFTIFYLLERMELIFNKALQAGLRTVCSYMMTVMGKIIVYSAQYDISMVTYPSRYLGRFAVDAQQNQMDSVADMATSTLLETTRTILKTLDISYVDLQEPIKTIIQGLSSIAKGTFKKNKNINIKILVQPLMDFKEMFQSEKMAAHPDTPSIIQYIDQVLGEFEVLEQVMKTIPPLDLSTSTG